MRTIKILKSLHVHECRYWHNNLEILTNTISFTSERTCIDLPGCIYLKQIEMQLGLRIVLISIYVYGKMIQFNFPQNFWILEKNPWYTLRKILISLTEMFLLQKGTVRYMWSFNCIGSCPHQVELWFSQTKCLPLGGFSYWFVSHIPFKLEIWESELWL